MTTMTTTTTHRAHAAATEAQTTQAPAAALPNTATLAATCAAAVTGEHAELQRGRMGRDRGAPGHHDHEGGRDRRAAGNEAGAAPDARQLVVVGAGQIGTPLVAHLAAAGHRVTWISRRTPPTVPSGAHHVCLDATDGAALGAQAAGADAILVAANPATYDAEVWARTLPPLYEGVIEAAARSGARLVMLDALYLYATDRGPLSPTTPRAPSTAKGRVRKQLAERVEAAQRSGRARITVLRASDFWGPDLHGAMLPAGAVRRIRDGKASFVVGNADAPHAFSHRDDVVHALSNLAFAAPDVEGQTFHAPVVHASPRQLVTAVADACGTRSQVITIPRWALRLGGLFWRSMRGVVEMLPQWSQPYRVDDSSYTARFTTQATSLHEGARALARHVQAAGRPDPHRDANVRLRSAL